MSFNVALSGLRAANQDLNVTGNNIANAGTTGFKQSRAEFADVYATSLLGSGARSPGNGVLVADIAQQFTQGNISITNNSLDLAISGQGFFVLQEQGGSRMYTRSGIFGLDKEGYVVGNNGARLQGFGADASGHIVEGAPHALRIETTDVSPKATTEISMRFNLDSREVGPRDDSGLKEFRPLDATSYNWSTAATVYDSLGNPHTLTTYYQKRDAAPGDPAATPPVPAVEEGWNMFIQIGNRFVS
ncbi:MAG: flagellar hook-basal body complex protein, partial [Spongiibacteraceae bacterium]|nr:flagellar hook-basal body complex protein [Spongiibacteraceae bacterium]